MSNTLKSNKTLNIKLVVIFGLVSLLSLTFWLVNRNAFKEISAIIEQLSSPNQKQTELELLNTNLSKYIRSHRHEALRNERHPSKDYFQQIESIDKNIDSLKVLFSQDTIQFQQLNLLDSIFLRQNDVFENYLKARYYYLNNTIQSEELASLNEDIRSANLTIDSNVISSETTTKTYTLLPPIKIPISEDDNKRNSKRKNQIEKQSTELNFIVEQEKDIHSDTTSFKPQQDSLIQRINKSITRVEKVTQSNRNQLRSLEIQLMENNELLIDQLFDALTKVKQEETFKNELQSKESLRISTNTLQKTKYVSIFFVLLALVLLIFIMLDLSRINTYRQQLEIAKATAEFNSLAKQRFLSNMSHEIRTPLQSIIGYSEMIQQTEANSKPIKALSQSSNHLLSVVNEMLDFSKIISGKLELKNDSFNFMDLIDELDQLFELDCKRNGLTWKHTLSGDLTDTTFVIGDQFRIRQIFYNVVGNAIKYTDTGTIHLTIHSSIKNQLLQLTIDIKDTGIGISPDKINTIFEEYEQVKNNPTIGTGLGLSIVKKITDTMNGTIQVSSKLNEGTQFTFNFSLPVSDESVSEMKPIETDSIQYNGEIWVVEDDALILQLCGHILTELSLEHKLFPSAEALLNEKEWSNVQLIMTDFRLPSMDGKELLIEIRKNHPAQKVVALTAQVLPEEQSDLLEAGFNELLLKPFKRSEFLSLLSRYSSKFDLTNIKKMVEDSEELASLIHQFKNDTKIDLQQLETHLHKNDVSHILEIVHKLAGRIGQFGHQQVSTQLKLIEQEGRHENQLSEDTKIELMNLITTIKKDLETL